MKATCWKTKFDGHLNAPPTREQLLEALAMLERVRPEDCNAAAQEVVGAVT